MPEVGCRSDEGKVKFLRIRFALVLVCVSIGSNTTESNSFFKISSRIFENKSCFLKDV